MSQSPQARPVTPEGRRFRQLMQRGGDGRPRVTLRRRNTWELPPPAFWGHGWLELYRDGRLVALWPDLAHIDHVLCRAPRRGSYVLLARDHAGIIRDRYLVRFGPAGPADFHFVVVRKP